MAIRYARATGRDAGYRLHARRFAGGDRKFYGCVPPRTGYVEGQNVTIEYRWANGSYDRQSSLMKELIDLRVNVIVTWGPTAIRTAKMVQDTGVGAAIPIVFAAGTDPVAEGIVASLNRPGGNITGVTSIAAALAPKRLQFLRELVPNVESIGLLTNSDDPVAVNERRDAEVAASTLGWRLHTVIAKNDRELDTAFETLGACLGNSGFYWREEGESDSRLA